MSRRVVGVAADGYGVLLEHALHQRQGQFHQFPVPVGRLFVICRNYRIWICSYEKAGRDLNKRGWIRGGRRITLALLVNWSSFRQPPLSPSLKLWLPYSATSSSVRTTFDFPKRYPGEVVSRSQRSLTVYEFLFLDDLPPARLLLHELVICRLPLHKVLLFSFNLNRSLSSPEMAYFFSFRIYSNRFQGIFRRGRSHVEGQWEEETRQDLPVLLHGPRGHLLLGEVVEEFGSLAGKISLVRNREEQLPETYRGALDVVH